MIAAWEELADAVRALAQTVWSIWSLKLARLAAWISRRVSP